jgi:hypothetical protein
MNDNIEMHELIMMMRGKYLSNSRDDASLLGQHFLDILIGVEAKW